LLTYAHKITGPTARVHVGKLSYIQRIQDFVTYSVANGLDFQLYVRPSTQLPALSQQAIANGQITQRLLPGAP
jgi:hypothetical protein